MIDSFLFISYNNDITSGWYWGLFFGELVTLISFILAGVGLLSIPVYLKALTLLGLGQIAKNTDKA